MESAYCWAWRRALLSWGWCSPDFRFEIGDGHIHAEAGEPVQDLRGASGILHGHYDGRGTPPLNFNIAGISDTAGPLQQPRLQVTLGSTFPVDVVVTLTLSFAPDIGADDPTIQFSGGGRTARITVPAGATNGATDVGVQTGSVAGLIAITAQMQATGQDVTPSPAPRLTIRIAAAAPVIVPGTLTAVRNSTGFTVTLTGYVTDRELTQAVFVFTAASGSN